MWTDGDSSGLRGGSLQRSLGAEPLMEVLAKHTRMVVWDKIINFAGVNSIATPRSGSIEIWHAALCYLRKV
jgi:hypothetical protein